MICINPIESVLRSDLTTVKIGSPLVGIYSVNQNNKTQKEFEDLLNKYYKPKKIETENEYLPANKIENSNLELSPKIKTYLQKIDLIIKKRNKNRKN